MLTQPKKHTTESGFTIIESLLAVIVIAIVLVGIGPIIAFSASTRLQSRRIEVGIQSARGYISGVQSGTIAPPPISHNTSSSVSLALKDVPAPVATTLTCTIANDYCAAPVQATGTNAYALYCIDQDGNGSCTTNSLTDLVIQAFGVQAPPTTGTLPDNFPIRNDPNRAAEAQQRPNAGYQLGIRVYRANSFGAGVILQNSTSTNPTGGRNQASAVTGGLGSRSLPVVEMTTEMGVEGSGGTRYEDFCTRINRSKSGSCN